MLVVNMFEEEKEERYFQDDERRPGDGRDLNIRWRNFAGDFDDEEDDFLGFFSVCLLWVSLCQFTKHYITFHWNRI